MIVLALRGINSNDNMMHSHVFKYVIPYVYPLFKIHKLSLEQIMEKVIPPIRLVHATREGPIYRLEKWVSPYLTTVSRKYCGEEFLLDTPELIDTIKSLNALNKYEAGKTTYLFTLDVVSLYPSIKPEIALEALKDALDGDNALTDDLRCVLYQFTDIIFSNSFVCFQGDVYTGKEGIPTGNCVSRQIADITLHWLLFGKIRDQIMELWKLISFWRRFIDDIVGRWHGTIRQFHLFVKKLNDCARPFGIQFGDFQIGKSVNFLDVTLYLDNQNNIDYKLFKKDTDARIFLKTDSFHPHHVFKSVVFSQMIRVIHRNSQEETCINDLTQLKQDLNKCGHMEDTLDEIEPLVVQRCIENDLNGNNGRVVREPVNQIVYSVKHFKELNDLKALVNNSRNDINELCGDIKITFAVRKNPSIGNSVVRNRGLSSVKSNDNTSQRCGGKGCLTCPLLFENTDSIIVNGTKVYLNMELTCKDCNIIYIAQCQLCNKSDKIRKDDTYFGQTVTPFNIRMNGHRSKFYIDSRLLFEKSALPMHCFLAHKSDFSLELFKLGIVKKVRPMELDREEDKLINKYKTNIWGLNRICVVR